MIGLGSNLANRWLTLRQAVERISVFAMVVSRSKVYESTAVGGPKQPDFLNAAILVEWNGTPIELLDKLQAVENQLGRVRSVPNAARTLDADILWIEDTTINTARLVVPHPRLMERAFALRPLLDVVPGAYVLPPGMIEDLGCRLTPDPLS